MPLSCSPVILKLPVRKKRKKESRVGSLHQTFLPVLSSSASLAVFENSIYGNEASAVLFL